MAFYELMSLFQPGLKHQAEERERERHEVVLPGDSTGGWDVDLDAGTAILAAPVAPSDDDPESDDGPELTRP